MMELLLLKAYIFILITVYYKLKQLNFIINSMVILNSNKYHFLDTIYAYEVFDILML